MYPNRLIACSAIQFSGLEVVREAERLVVVFPVEVFEDSAAVRANKTVEMIQIRLVHQHDHSFERQLADLAYRTLLLLRRLENLKGRS